MRKRTITARDITEALLELGVERSDTLLVHSSVRACLRVAGATVNAKLETILEGLAEAVRDGALVMPTFSYSFCEREVFDVDRTPSRVGALTELFRHASGVRRTADPIFSMAALGATDANWDELFVPGDLDCLGARSMFGYLGEINAKFLFFGIGLEHCTFVHHIERRLNVPYRYMKTFSGIVQWNGRRQPVDAHYFVRYLDGSVETCLEPLCASLCASGQARAMTLTAGPRLCMTDAGSVTAAVIEGLRTNPSFLLRRGHAPQPSPPLLAAHAN
jgi:aminoglycoside 3-N-acetyltransferase